MLGQEKLIQKIDNYTLQTLPHSILLEGKKGCGKHMLVNYISEKFGLQIVDLTENIELEAINNIYLEPFPRFYLVEINKISVKEENMILKLVEEPPANAFLLLLCENKTQVISTIINRCQLLTFSEYSKETLSHFSKDEIILSICKTPGQVLRFEERKSDIPALVDLCNKIYDKIANANVQNTLTIPNKIALNNEQDKLDFDMFKEVLIWTSKNKAIENDRAKLLEAYKLTDKFYNDLNIAHIDKKDLLENFLLTLKYTLI